ncbi:MAG TPA: EamA family transporter [Candidatus Dormibacteraeota bacterium]|nr:EamA family transporter [Candidatus Dormibacteraeota bacterium]
MIAAAVALALAAAAIHGTWNVLVKVGGDPLTTFERASFAAAFFATAALVPAWALLGRPSLPPEAAAWCLLSSTLETAYMWLLSTAYRRGELSVVYPIARGSAPLIAVFVALAFIGERLQPLQLAGVGLLLVGILTVTLSQAKGHATLPALLTGMAIALYTSVDRIGVRLTTPWLYGWLLFALMAIELPLSIRVASWLRGAPPRDSGLIPGWRKSSVIGAFMWAGYALVLWALSLAPLAVVAPVRETAIVAVAVWGVWRLRERKGAVARLAGAAATLAGVVLLAV